MKLLRMVVVPVALLAAARLVPSQIDPIREGYTKYEYAIPMRDGAKLFTSIYVPKDDSKSYPILLNRTPYSVAPYGVDRYKTALGPSEHFSKDGFIFVYQDVRGRHMSEGEWTELRPHLPVKNGPRDVDESTDTYDTIEWLVRSVRNNSGKVGLWGISYPGFFAAAGMIDAHPALKAVSPQAPVGDTAMGDDTFHNGAFFLGANFGFYSFFVDRKGGPELPKERVRFDYGTPDAYDFFLRLGPLSNANLRYFKGENSGWNAGVEHTRYDEYWRSRAIVRHLKGIRPAVMTVGGWFDAEDLAGSLGVYRAVEAGSSGSRNLLVMGPWSHGAWARGDGDRLGNLDFGQKTAVHYREKIELPFFQQALKGASGETLPEAYLFQTGSNEWRRFDTWPPTAAAKRSLYLAASGQLSFEAPASASEAFDEYLSDPAKPVPYLGYTAGAMRGDYMTEDQRFAASRPDVLVYETEPLAEDLTVVGPIDVNLHVSTTGTDSDFVVKLIDVYPGDFPNPPRPSGAQSGPDPANLVKMGGYQQLVRGEPFRGKFRRSFEKPEPFEPGKPAAISFRMPDVCHSFRKGHRVMVQVQSSWFPLVDRNPQTFVDVPNARPEDFQKATQRVYRSKAMPSSLSFLVETERSRPATAPAAKSR